MRRGIKLILLSLCTMVCAGMNAQNEASFSVDPVIVMSGENTTVSVKMTNTVTVASAVFAIKLPDGVRLVTRSNADENCTYTTISSSRKNTATVLYDNYTEQDNTLHVVINGMGQTLKGSTGTIASFQITADEGTASGKATLCSQSWSNADASKGGSIADKEFDVSVDPHYTLTYKVDGEVYETQSVLYKSPLEKIDDPVKKGYTFSGWGYMPQTMPARDVVVVGSFKINQYTISFNTDGGSDVAAITQNYASKVTAPAAPTRTGYTFAGWDKEIPETMPAENMAIKALWTINQYKVSFVSDGKSVSEQTLDYGTKIAAPEDPTKEGYTFTGWSPKVAETVPAADVTYTALFSINSYKLVYKVDGAVYKEYTNDFSSKITAENAPTKTGYTFSGWSEIPETMPAHDVEVTGSFTINQYTISFDTDGGSKVAAITQNYASKVTAPAAPTKTGYTFAGWDKEIPAIMPAGDVTVKALWTINQYTISFDTDGGSKVANITQDYASRVTAPAAPTRTGYTFAGWDKEIPETMPAENVAVKALWTINQYKVSFVSEGKVISEQTLDYGSKITAPADPTKEGYTFTGWSEDVAETVPATDVTYTAQFCINSYKISYYYDGSLVHEEELEFGSEISTYEYHLTDGTPCNEWEGEEHKTMPAHDLTYNASQDFVDGLRRTNARKDADTIYNLNGNKLNKVQKGINIVGGKKVLVK